MGSVPIYRLYGEESAKEPDFWLHCETLYSRSSIHRFEIDIHRHDTLLQILHISDGEGDAILDGKSYAIIPPAAIIVPAQVNHGFRFSRAIKGVVVTVLPAALPIATRTHLHNTYPRPALIALGDHPDGPHIHSTMTNIEREYSSARPIRNALLENYLATVLLLLTPETNQTSPLPGQDAQRMEKLANLIARYFRQQQRAEFYADHLNLSTTHLNRIAKGISGKTLQQLIAQKQIETAKQELIFSHASVQTIALHLGFNDPAYFSRFFMRETGVTPRAWRMAEKQRQAEMTDRFYDPSPQQRPN